MTKCMYISMCVYINAYICVCVCARAHMFVSSMQQGPEQRMWQRYSNKYNSKLSLHLCFIFSHLGSNSLGHWKVGEWTDVGNINRQNNGKGPLRGPLGIVHEAGVLLAETETQYNTSISAIILHLESKARNANNNHKRRKGQQNNK